MLLVAGPPAGAPLFRAVVARLGQGEAKDVTDNAHVDHGWMERGAVLAEQVAARPTVLVAHGLAVPAAVAAALASPPETLVLSNGPLTRLDPFTAALARVAAAPGGVPVLAETLLRPSVWLRWLASSAGLRRAVVNPYVMDRDTVATVCGGLVADAPGRRAVASYLRSLARGLPDARALRCPVWLVWGNDDALYPASEATWLESGLPGCTHRAVPGGRFLHPEERPWELADSLAALISDQGGVGVTATRVS